MGWEGYCPQSAKRGKNVVFSYQCLQNEEGPVGRIRVDARV